MKSTAVALAALFGICLCAETPGGAYGFIPDPAARAGGVDISRAEALKILARRRPPDEKAAADEIKSLLKDAVSEEMCVRLTREMLKREKIVPSYERARKFLDDQESQLTSVSGETPLNETQRRTLANDELYQLSVALREYFLRTAPDRIAVSDFECEYFYRSHQLRFLRIPPPEFRIFTRPENRLGELEKIHAMLRQSPEKLPEQDSISGVEADEAVKLKNAFLASDAAQPHPLHTPTPIVRYGNAAMFAVVLDRPIPEYIPFAEVRQPIRNFLQSRRAAELLRRILEENVRRAGLEFNF